MRKDNGHQQKKKKEKEREKETLGTVNILYCHFTIITLETLWS